MGSPWEIEAEGSYLTLHEGSANIISPPLYV